MEAKAGSELCLCFPKQVLLENIGRKRGFIDDTFLEYLIDPAYIPRYVAEHSKEFVHVVTYNVIVGPQGILTYNRGKPSTCWICPDVLSARRGGCDEGRNPEHGMGEGFFQDRP